MLPRATTKAASRLVRRVPALLWEEDADRSQSNDSQMAGNRASAVSMRTELLIFRQQLEEENCKVTLFRYVSMYPTLLDGISVSLLFMQTY